MAALTRSGGHCLPMSPQMERGGEGSGSRRRNPVAFAVAGGGEITAEGEAEQHPGSVGIWRLHLPEDFETRQPTGAGFCPRTGNSPTAPSVSLRHHRRRSCSGIRSHLFLVLLQLTISSQFAYLYLITIYYLRMINMIFTIKIL